MGRIGASRALVTGLGALALAAGAPAAPITVLHEFSGGEVDGTSPTTPLAVHGGVLYGTTYRGTGSHTGTVYRIATDGSGYQILHEFPEPPEPPLPGFPRPSNPQEGYPLRVVTDGTTIYGTTSYDDCCDSEITSIWSMNTDGSGYSVLHTQPQSDDLYVPVAGELEDGRLYGTAHGHPDNDETWGSLWSMAADGSDLQTIHGIQPQSIAPRWLNSGLVVANGWVYGSSWGGGYDDSGTLFRAGVDGQGFEVLHHFLWDAGSPQPGSVALPMGVLHSQGRLYGMGRGGGELEAGGIFAVDIDGSNMEVLYEFQGGELSRVDWNQQLVMVGGRLFGVIGNGVFVLDIDGSNFELVGEFGNEPGWIRDPGGLVHADGWLFGVSSGGGASNLGTIFSVPVPEPGTGLLLAAGLSALSLRRRRGA